MNHAIGIDWGVLNQGKAKTEREESSHAAGAVQ
jgi:hypothetical protein